MKKIIKKLIPYIIILLIVIVVRTYVVTPITVSGKSMLPTLHGNELMMLQKFGNINRYDVIVVDYKDDHLIKRVYGMPGETIECIDGVIYINDKVLSDEYGSGTTNDFKKIKLKEDEYFVLGDNRSDSLDSIIIGPVKKEDILGKTSFVIYPFKEFGNIE